MEGSVGSICILLLLLIVLLLLGRGKKEKRDHWAKLEAEKASEKGQVRG